MHLFCCENVPISQLPLTYLSDIHRFLLFIVGDVASRRLAARLIPRFIDQYPEHVELAAVALTNLHSRQQSSDASELKHIDEITKQDALNGLPSVLQAAQRCKPPGDGAVEHVLDYLLRSVVYDTHVRADGLSGHVRDAAQSIAAGWCC